MKFYYSIFLQLAILAGLLAVQNNAHAQTITVQDDFEGNGTISGWYGDGCNVNAAFANPFKTGINTSATVLEYDDQGGQYANIRFDVTSNFDLSENHIFSLKIYVPSGGLTGNQTNQISLKIQDGSLPEPWTTQSEIIKPLVLNEWQTITFNFSTDSYINFNPSSVPPTQRTDFNRVLIQLNGENNTDHVLAYIDDVLYNGTLPAPPVFDELIWSDEFDGSGALDASKWFHQTKLPIAGSWYNGEVQHYTNRTDNAMVENGILKIIAKKETFTDQGYTKNYTSARLNSKFTFTYGKVEVRAKLPSGLGTWPAIWMLGKNINEDGAYWDNEGFGTSDWPACGEVDIMEHWGHNQNYVQSAMHTPSSSGSTSNIGGQMVPTASTDFHVYSVEWTSEKMVFAVDGIIHYTYNPAVKDASTWPFDKEQYLLLNVALQSSVETSYTSSAMEVDYVRVYSQSNTSKAELADKTTAPKFYPNPVNDQLHISLQKPASADISINIYTLSGKLVKTYTVSANSSEINLTGLSDLASGMYLVTYPTDQSPQYFKISKQ